MIFRGIQITVRLSELRYVEKESNKQIYLVFMDGSVTWAIYKYRFDADRDYQGLSSALEDNSNYRGIKEMAGHD